jgi:hypothetical protein
MYTCALHEVWIIHKAHLKNNVSENMFVPNSYLRPGNWVVFCTLKWEVSLSNVFHYVSLYFIMFTSYFSWHYNSGYVRLRQRLVLWWKMRRWILFTSVFVFLKMDTLNKICAGQKGTLIFLKLYEYVVMRDVFLTRTFLCALSGNLVAFS